MLGDLPVNDDDRVLIDYRTSDDAGVYRLDDAHALVQTVEFFTPIVDDPFVYGQIAAANALSDVYAMGGRPLTALAIAAFPKDLDRSVLKQIFAGGRGTAPIRPRHARPHCTQGEGRRDRNRFRLGRRTEPALRVPDRALKPLKP